MLGHLEDVSTGQFSVVDLWYGSAVLVDLVRVFFDLFNMHG